MKRGRFQPPNISAAGFEVERLKTLEMRNREEKQMETLLSREEISVVGSIGVRNHSE